MAFRSLLFVMLGVPSRVDGYSCPQLHSLGDGTRADRARSRGGTQASFPNRVAQPTQRNHTGRDSDDARRSTALANRCVVAGAANAVTVTGDRHVTRMWPKERLMHPDSTPVTDEPEAGTELPNGIESEDVTGVPQAGELPDELRQMLTDAGLDVDITAEAPEADPPYNASAEIVAVLEAVGVTGGDDRFDAAAQLLTDHRPLVDTLAEEATAAGLFASPALVGVALESSRKFRAAVERDELDKVGLITATHAALTTLHG